MSRTASSWASASWASRLGRRRGRSGRRSGRQLPGYDFLDTASRAAAFSAAGGVSGCVSTASAAASADSAAMAGEADGASAASCAKAASAVSAPAISGAAGKGAAASVSAAGTNAWSSSPNSTSRPWRAAKAARSAALASSEENWSVPFSMTVTCESIRSQIRPSLPISRNRQAISRSTRAPLRTGASRCSSARLSSASTADSSAASTELRMAASASVRRSCAAAAAATASAACCAERPSSAPLEACLPLKGLFPLGGEALLDPRHRIQHHAGVGIAVALGVFGQEPAAPRSLHEGFGDRRIVLLARQRGACRDRRKGECFVGHVKLFAQISAHCDNETTRYCPNRN